MSARVAPVGGHHIEIRCCDVVHYASPDPIHEGEIIRPESLLRICTDCPEPAHGLVVRCCVCGKGIQELYSRTTNEVCNWKGEWSPAA